MNLGTISLGGTIGIPAFAASATAITYTVRGDDGAVVTGPTAMDAVSGETDCYLSLLAATTAAGFVAGKQYSVLIEATVAAASVYEWHTFNVEAETPAICAPVWTVFKGETAAANRAVFVDMVLAGGSRARATGLTVTVTIWKPGSAEFAAIAGSVAEVGYGSYKIALAAGDVDTEGFGLLRCTAASAVDVVVPVWFLHKARLLEAATADLTLAGSAGKLIADDLPLLINRLGAFTGTGVETVLGWLNAMANGGATKPAGWTEFQSAYSALSVIGGDIAALSPSILSTSAGVTSLVSEATAAIYTARVAYLADDVASADEYTVSFQRNGANIPGGGATPTAVQIKAYKRLDGSLLFTDVMTKIGSTSYYKYDAAGAARLGIGDSAVVEMTLVFPMPTAPVRVSEVISREA
jgi:hypothetical protein